MTPAIAGSISPTEIERERGNKSSPFRGHISIICCVSVFDCSSCSSHCHLENVKAFFPAHEIRKGA